MKNSSLELSFLLGPYSSAFLVKDVANGITFASTTAGTTTTGCDDVDGQGEGGELVVGALAAAAGMETQIRGIPAAAKDIRENAT